MWTPTGGIDSSCFASAVGYKLYGDSRFSLGDKLDRLAERCRDGDLDGPGVMRILRSFIKFKFLAIDDSQLLSTVPAHSTHLFSLQRRSSAADQLGDR